MSESIPDMPIEEYLAMVATNPNLVEQSERAPSEIPEGLIPAEAVKDIVGNLTVHMEKLTKQMEEAKATSNVPYTSHVNVNQFLDEQPEVADLVDVSIAPDQLPQSQLMSSPINQLLLLNEDRKIPIHVSQPSTSIPLASVITTTTSADIIYTQTSTTPLNVVPSRPYQPFQSFVSPIRPTFIPNPVPPPITVNSQNNMFTSSQFDIIQQQLSLLTQTVSLLTVLVQNSQQPKLIEPKVYSYEKEHKLPQFLEYFELYCKKKYPQSPDQWVRLLEKYLSGKFLNLYNVITKNTSDYNKVKDTLLKWYVQEDKKRNENKLQAYHAAKRKNGEDVNLFALRLEQLAEQAFPGVNMKEHESLRTAFVLSLPLKVQNKLREYIIQNEMCTQTKVPWDKLVLLADSYDREFQPWQNITSQSDIPNPSLIRDPSKDIEVIQIDSLTPQATWSEILKKAPSKNIQQAQTRSPPLNQNDSRYQRQTNSVNSQKVCSYCGIRGHTVDVCYKALGICSYCKVKGHIRNDCWHNNRNRSPRQNINSQLECPSCSGNHLGINCQSRNHSPKPINIDNPPSNDSPRGLNFSPPLNENTVPLPQRTHRNSQSRVFANSNLGNDSWTNTGAKPKSHHISNCAMCGESHDAGECLGDPENYQTPQ